MCVSQCGYKFALRMFYGDWGWEAESDRVEIGRTRGVRIHIWGWFFLFFLLHLLLSSIFSFTKFIYTFIIITIPSVWYSKGIVVLSFSCMYISRMLNECEGGFTSKYTIRLFLCSTRLCCSILLLVSDAVAVALLTIPSIILLTAACSGWLCSRMMMS